MEAIPLSVFSEIQPDGRQPKDIRRKGQKRGIVEISKMKNKESVLFIFLFFFFF